MNPRLWLRQVLALALKEFLTILKDPKSRFVVIGPPLVQFIVFGYAATFDVTHVDYAIVDEDMVSKLIGNVSIEIGFLH